MRPTKRRTRETPAVRRRQILDAAVALFLDHGYEDTTVASVARSAGIATGTVYMYFASKEHLLEALHDEFHDKLRAAVLDVADELLGEAAHGRPLDQGRAVARLIDALGRSVLANREQCTVIVRYFPRLGADSPALAKDRDFIELLATMLEEGVRRGAAEVSDPAMAAELIAAGIRVPLGRLVSQGDLEGAKRFLRQASQFISKAVAPQH
jgi:AcrR family transcriptional regulator